MEDICRVICAGSIIEHNELHGATVGLPGLEREYFEGGRQEGSRVVNRHYDADLANRQNITIERMKAFRGKMVASSSLAALQLEGERETSIGGLLLVWRSGRRRSHIVRLHWLHHRTV